MISPYVVFIYVGKIVKIQKSSLESLVSEVVLPFEHLVMSDERLAFYLKDENVAKLHNMAIAKLTIYIYSDIDRAYEYVQKGAKSHKEKLIQIPFLKEFYSVYFRLCREWKDKHLDSNETFESNIEIIEKFVYESFASEEESLEDFFEYASEVVNSDIEKMHYKDSEKMSAKAFFELESIDELEIQDMKESSIELQDTVASSNSLSVKYIENITIQLDIFARILEKNIEFKDIGFSLSKLSEILKNFKDTLPTHQKAKNIYISLNGIAEDMVSWTRVLFDEQSVVDIHYLDASLLSSIIQIEMLLTASEDEDDDLEFF